MSDEELFDALADQFIRDHLERNRRQYLRRPSKNSDKGNADWPLARLVADLRVRQSENGGCNGGMQPMVEEMNLVEDTRLGFLFQKTVVRRLDSLGLFEPVAADRDPALMLTNLYATGRKRVADWILRDLPQKLHRSSIVYQLKIGKLSVSERDRLLAV